MDTPERSEGTLTPWSPGPLAPHAAAPAWDPAADGPPPKAFNVQIVLRAVRRHWWQILAIWFVGTAGLVYLAQTKVNPNYDAISWLQVEPAAKSLLTNINATGGDAFAPYLETQVLLITSPDVIAEAISNKAIAAMPRVRSSLDPEQDLRKDIAVVPQPKTHVIQVKMTGENSKEVTTIVNAVVNAYMKKARSWTDQEVQAQIITLEGMKKKYETDAATLKRDLRAKLEQTGDAGKDRPKADQDDRDSEGGGRLRITMEQYRSYKLRLAEIEIERARQEATVVYLREELKNHPTASSASPSGQPPSPEEIKRQVEEEFQATPAVASVLDEIDRQKTYLEGLERKVRAGRPDPAHAAAKKKLEAAMARYDELWVKMYPFLARKVAQLPPATATISNANAANSEAELRHAKLQLHSLEIQERLLGQQIKSVEIEAADQNKNVIDVRFIEEEINYNDTLLTTVKRNLEQLGYEQTDGSRIKLIAAAKETKMPSSNNRLKIMAAAPVIMLVLAAGLFVLLEARSGRVADPDDLPARVRLGVLGVVPPLPSLQPSRPLSLRGARDEKRRVEEFVQSLDHLRVTLCAPRPGKSHRRCVLITSACGGEGKTTLAAQLAGRCANAGLMTLLIDADLRRPSLGELLEVPEGPGLVDVLTGEASPEAAMVVIGNAGGFHLLPAGTMGQDPSRLLHGDRLGLLLAQFRESFDMVIIDAPPVLAVPDALLLGRWTDGAVLAVRHDTSRFPLVERANKRLASVGVPVLGAVVNGVRTVESNYGSYRYTPYAAAAAPDADADVPLE